MGPYRIARRLSAAAGGAESFVGVEVPSDQPVVVKRLSAALPDGATRSWSDLARRGVPGLVDVLEVGTAREQLWLVQALVEAEPLRQVMTALSKKKGFISPSEGLAVVGRLAALLATLHERPEPIVHGDVCATNTLLSVDGGLLLTDAGLAAAAKATEAGPARAEPFTVAPEQLAHEASAATDVFRLGLMLYELAVGHPLFATGDATQALVLCQRFTGLQREAVAQVPEPWRSLLVEMLAVEPIDRPTAAQVERTLADAAAKAGWGPPEDDISRLMQRALPSRRPLAELARGDGQLLELTPLGHEGLGQRSPLAPRPSGRSAGVPEVPRSPPSPSPASSKASPPRIRSSASPLPLERPSRSPPSPPPPPSGTVVGRICTRKMSRSELDAARAERLPSPPPPAPEEPPPPMHDAKEPRDARLGELLVEQALITPSQLEEARAQVGTYGGTLADALASIGACDEDAIVVTLSGVTKTPHLSAHKLAELTPPVEALAKVPFELARQLELVPLGLKGGAQLLVAMKDPLDMTAQDLLKSATGLRSVVAMRAGETAIRRARNRFYARPADDAADWHEAMKPPARPLPPPPPPSPPPVVSSPSGLEAPVVTGSLVSSDSGLVAAGLSLERGSGRLVPVLLRLLGEPGLAVLGLAKAAAGVATRLGAPPSEVDRVRFAAAAVAVANLHDGRPIFEVPTVNGLAQVLGEDGWNAVEPLVGPWLDWPSTFPGDPSAQALCLVFGFAHHTHTPRLRPNQLAGALTSFRARYQPAPPLLDALSAELSAD